MIISGIALLYYSNNYAPTVITEVSAIKYPIDLDRYTPFLALMASV
jgi:hypothetical protein